MNAIPASDSIVESGKSEQSTGGGANGFGKPDLPSTHYLDNRIFTDEAIFLEEQKKIFAKTWQFVCHESELAKRGDFRSIKIAGKPVIVVRGEDGVVRGFFNVCRHRSAELVREESGNAMSFTCFYHHWNYDLKGSLRAISKPSGYDAVKLDKKCLGLIPVRTEVLVGLVFATLDPQSIPLREFLGPIVEPFEKALGEQPMQVFHFHKAVVLTNWKLWQDNNSERYHGLLHYLNSKTQPWVMDKTSPMKLHIYDHGHSGYWSDGSAVVAYEKSGYDGISGWPLPGLQVNEMRVVNIFPDLMINIRSNIVRIDRMVPLSAGRTLVEWRGLCVKDDSEEAQAVRLRHHNLNWGPAGRNVPEDILAVESQWRSMAAEVVRYSILAREEDLNPTDDENLRAYYREWERRMGRSAADPFAEEVFRAGA